MLRLVPVIAVAAEPRYDVVCGGFGRVARLITVVGQEPCDCRER